MWGRLPLCLRELLTLLGCDDTDDTDDLPAWDQYDDSQVWAGWRGPYLIGNTELSGEVHFVMVTVTQVERRVVRLTTGKIQVGI